jgi:phosphatidylglycerol:prolipoprotein diacylglycerol transferase
VTHPIFAAFGPIVHHPFEFGIGPLQFTGFGIAVVLGFVVAQMIGQEEMQRRGFDPTPIGDMIFGAVVGGLLGAKLYFVVVLGHWDSLFARGGFVFWGGLIGGTVGVLLIAWRKRVPLWRVAEVGAPAVAAAYAIGRTGCWAVGDDYGHPWNGPLAVQFPQGAPASTAGIMAREFNVTLPPGTDPNTVLAVHPTQLYEVTLALIMFGVLWRLRRHQHAEGWLIGVYLVLAGIERFIIEFFRAKDDVLSIGITSAQLIAIFAVLGGAIVMYARRAPALQRSAIGA